MKADLNIAALMECEICDKLSRERVKVFIRGDKESYLETPAKMVKALQLSDFITY